MHTSAELRPGNRSPAPQTDRSRAWQQKKKDMKEEREKKKRDWIQEELKMRMMKKRMARKKKELQDEAEKRKNDKENR